MMAYEFGATLKSFYSCKIQHMLLLASSCPRHILKTLAQNPKTETEMYVMDTHLDITARHLLLLTLIANADNLQESTDTFLEIYGNILLQEKTDKLVQWTCTDLIKFVTSESTANLDYFKYKDKDMLESIFKFWKDCSNHSLKIAKHWDERQRIYLQTQYDSREAVYDWDYHMKLKDRAEIISWEEYSHWRNSGVAYTQNNLEMTCPNLTLISGICGDMENKTKKGYYGDIVTGPFISFGIQSECARLFIKENGRFLKQSQDVAATNLSSIISKLHTEHNAFTDFRKICERQLHFLPPSSELKKKAMFKHYFSFIYIGFNLSHTFPAEWMDVLSNRATIIIEIPRFILNMSDKDVDMFVQDIREKAISYGLEEGEMVDPHNSFSFLKFTNTKD